jgi:hypothetical protein
LQVGDFVLNECWRTIVPHVPGNGSIPIPIQPPVDEREENCRESGSSSREHFCSGIVVKIDASGGHLTLVGAKGRQFVVHATQVMGTEIEEAEHSFLPGHPSTLAGHPSTLPGHLSFLDILPGCPSWASFLPSWMPGIDEAKNAPNCVRFLQMVTWVRQTAALPATSVAPSPLPARSNMSASSPFVKQNGSASSDKTPLTPEQHERIHRNRERAKLRLKDKTVHMSPVQQGSRRSFHKKARTAELRMDPGLGMGASCVADNALCGEGLCLENAVGDKFYSWLVRSQDERLREINAGVITRCDIAMSAKGKVKSVALSESKKVNSLERKFGHECAFVRVKFDFESHDMRNECDRIQQHIMDKGLCATRDGKHFYFQFYGGKGKGDDSADIFVAGLPATTIRSWVGNFSDMAMHASKMNKRLELPLSDTVPALKVRRHQLSLVDDIMSDDGAIVMTDGCGWIGADLAKKVRDAAPAGIKGGQLMEPREYIDPDTDEMPAAMQVRLNCWHGLYKGMLVVSSLPKHKNKIGLRKSMHKVKPSLRWQNSAETETTLDVVSTTFQSSRLCANSDLLFMLEANGVSYSFLENVLDKELNKTLLLMSGEDSRNVRLLAEKMLKSGGGEDTECCSMLKMGLQMISAGISLNEPYLRHILEKVSGNHCQRLSKKMRIPLHDDGDRLFGIPDPTDPPSLEEGQIYVRVGKHHAMSLHHGMQVLVTRDPMVHPGDLQKLRHVDNKEVSSFLGNRRNVVVFSVKGNRPTADMLSGGDYDGDMFIVLWNQVLVNKMKRVAPRAIQPQPTTNSSIATKGFRVNDLINARLKVRHDNTMERAATLRMVHADKHGAAHDSCLELGQIYAEAIDAEKTGAQVKIPQKYAGIKKKPHWWKPWKDEKRYHSTSVVGKLYDRIECTPSKFTRADNGMDKDLLVNGRNKYREAAETIRMHWAEAWKSYNKNNDRFFDPDEEKKQAALTREKIIHELRSKFDALHAQDEKLMLASAVYEEGFGLRNGEEKFNMCFLVCGVELNNLKREKLRERSVED